MSDRVVRTEHDGHVSVVTIDRPERRNALDAGALEGLVGGIAEAGDNGARVLVITGAGGHFCSGADLSGVEDPGFVARLNDVLESLRSMPGVTIAAAEGAALGAGTQLAMACDLRVATTDATFGIPAAKLGLMVDHWTVQRLATMVGQPTARAMLLTAETFNGEEAAHAGWVQRLGSPSDALAWAHEIAKLAPLTIAGHKVGLNEIEHLQGSSAAYSTAREQAWQSADLQEGLAAFRDRRRPDFTGS